MVCLPFAGFVKVVFANAWHRPVFGTILRKFKGDPGSSRPERPVEKTAPSMPKPGLALSSGGARGLAHVRVLQVLEENGFKIHAISGPFMGSNVSALWAAGFSENDLVKLAWETHDRRQLWKPAEPVIPPIRGLFREPPNSSR